MSGPHPLPPTAISRRGLLGALGVAAGALAVGGSAVAVAAGTRATEPLRRSAWTPIVGSAVAITAGGVRRRATVAAIDDLGMEDSRVREECEGREDAFAIVFTLRGAALPPEILTVEHPVHGAIPLFLTGGSRSAGARRYVATIDRRTAA